MSLRVLIHEAKTVIQVTTRYGKGGPPKNPCKGPCEGMGFVPAREDDPDPRLAKLWKAAEKKKPSKDGYHFVTCPDCNGSGSATA